MLLYKRTASWYHIPDLRQWTVDVLISAKINSCLLWLICYFLETKKSYCYIVRYGPDLHCSPIDCGPPQVRTSLKSLPNTTTTLISSWLIFYFASG